MIQRMTHSTLSAVEAEADQLWRDVQGDSPDAISVVAEYLPSSGEVDSSATHAEFSIDDARLTIARQYGYGRWRHLETYMIATSGGDQDSDFTKISCLNYLRIEDSDYELARQMLAENPSLAGRDIYHACCVGDVAAVKGMLEADGSIVNRPGGYFGWEPLMYACYARLNLPGKSTLEVVRLLLKNGADPNAHYMWGGHYRFTALTGVFGQGEGGPGRFPEHPECESVARVLLDAGADPNDCQALYNRMFTPGSFCLELLLQYGLGTEHTNNWYVLDGGAVRPEGKRTLRYQLNYALKAGFADRVRLLVQHGTDLSTEGEDLPPYEMAMLQGDHELAEFLVENGAERVKLSPESEFQSACMCVDKERAHQLLTENPELSKNVGRVLSRFINEAATAHRYETIRFIAELGGDLDKNNPLCQAVWHGDLEMVKLLIELGANPSATDAVHNATALQWANHHGGREEIAAYLGTC